MVLEVNTSMVYKKQAFTIENLAKSSREENHGKKSETLFNGINTTLEGIVFGYFPTSSIPSPEPDRLTPLSDPGYKSLNNTPPKSEETPLKRRRCSSGSDEQSLPTIPSSSSHSDVSYDSISPYTSDTDTCLDDQNRRKKARTAFSTEQVYGLEQRYQVQKYLPSSERSRLAKKLALTDQQVKTWFQNRRMKEKRHQRDEEQTRNFYLPTGGVDIAQLHAMGMPCPPPYTTQTPNFGQLFPSPINSAMSGYQLNSSMHSTVPSSNGPDRLHPGLGYSPVLGPLPMFPSQSTSSRHAPVVPAPLTSTPVAKSLTYFSDTRGRSPA
ncbi:homeobox protein vent1-like [Argopecten irradians]|uniref:homeobox protein vent1-like n=1 Tax=Argopecten irradians TaxID=31199 RepID=UPI00371EF4BC